MENLFIHNHREVFFIKVFFRILVAFFGLIAICIITFDINDSVSFSVGEIIAEKPQLDYKAPFEAIPDKIFVKEGQTVRAGDTLMILVNEQVRKNYRDAESAFITKRKINNTISDLMATTNDKIINLKKEKIFSLRVQNSQKKRMINDLQSARQQADVNIEKLESVALAKLKIDSSLYKEEVISKLDITNSFDNYLSYKNSVIQSSQNQSQIQSDLEYMNDENLKTQNYLDYKLILLNEEIGNLNKEKSESDKDLRSAVDNLKFAEAEAHKQFIIAEVEGQVLNLFNLKYAQNFVNKNDLLMSVIPGKDKFYAKVTIPQRDIRYVKIGQMAYLKLDVFNFYEKGILRGKVSYVPERKPKEDFFIIIDLPPNQDLKLKAGYSIKGEIVIERLKLYQFIAKKLFKKFEITPKPSVAISR